MTTTPARPVEVYSTGLCYLSACVADEIGDEEAAERVNRSHPTGIPSSWQVSADPRFAGGKPNPCPCEDEPDARRHVLFQC